MQPKLPATLGARTLAQALWRVVDTAQAGGVVAYHNDYDLACVTAARLLRAYGGGQSRFAVLRNTQHVAAK
ncbi:MAG: hypothetical protein KGH93_03590 [Patescibacteria group bacterium]|nr:hypothetical protein [Patescibacteria group bacterium]